MEYKVKKERVKKYEAMAKLRRKGLTLDEIGTKFNMSRQGVRDILKRHFKDEVFQKSNYTPKITVKCKECPKKFTKYVTSPQVACSIQCGAILRQKNYKKTIKEKIKKGLTFYSKYVPKKMRMEAERIRANKWYHKHKNDPAFKQKIKERNEKQIAKRKANDVMFLKEN